MQDDGDSLLGLPWVTGNSLRSIVTAQVSQGLYSAIYLPWSCQDLETHCFWLLGPMLPLTITVSAGSFPLSSCASPNRLIQHLHHEVIHETPQGPFAS